MRGGCGQGGGAFGWLQWPQQKILRQRRIEVVGYERHGVGDPPRRQIGLARSKIQPASLAVGHQIEHRATIARHNNGFPRLDFAGEFGQAVFHIPDGN